MNNSEHLTECYFRTKSDRHHVRMESFSVLEKIDFPKSWKTAGRDICGNICTLNLWSLFSSTVILCPLNLLQNGKIQIFENIPLNVLEQFIG